MLRRLLLLQPILLFVALAVIFTTTYQSILRVRSVHSSQQFPTQHHNRPVTLRQASSDRLDKSVHYFGFDYPQLKGTRSLITAVCCEQQLPWVELKAGYAAALALLEGDSSSWKLIQPSSLKSFLTEALSAFQALQPSGGLLTCRQDPSLISAWQRVHPLHQGNQSEAAAATQQQQLDDHGANSNVRKRKKYLLAANFHNSAEVLPSFAHQLLRLLLLLPPGSLAVSAYESGSSDTSRVWLTLLHQLLLPLSVPHNITTAGQLSPRLKLPRIQLLAALRNAVTQPWLGQQQQQQQQQQQVPRSAAAGSTGSGHQAGASELSAATAGFVPDAIVFVNDVFFCAEDVVRLAMHGAHIACGLDFYSASWMVAAGDNGQAAAEATTTRLTAAAGTTTAISGSGTAAGHDNGGAGASGNAAAAQAAGLQHASHGGESSSSESSSDDDDDFFDPAKLHEDAETASSSGSSSSHHHVGSSAPSGLRFYDKWVARDVSGHRLRNRAPFIAHHEPSQAQLGAGQPVAATCCWNGLALLDATPFKRGLRFRSHQPGECAASECSLMCEDFARLGFSHVVIDPGVRLAYQHEQVNMLGGIAAAAAAAGQEAPDGQQQQQQVQAHTADGVVPGLGPLLMWQQVAETSQQLEAQSKQDSSDAAGCRTAQQPQLPSTDVVNMSAESCSSPIRLMECCDLLPGASYVDFRSNCHMVNVMAHNYTAEVLVAL